MRTSFLRSSEEGCTPRRRVAGGASASRSGIALMVVLVALAIVSSIATTLLRLALMHNKQAERHVQVAQSRWLAESACQLAAERLQADPKLEGFTWSVPAAELDGRHSAHVTITIRPVEQQPQRREVTVVADFPQNPSQRTRTRLVRSIDL